MVVDGWWSFVPHPPHPMSRTIPSAVSPFSPFHIPLTLPSPPCPQTALKRINKEIAALAKETDLGGILLRPTDTDITRWTCSLPGPSVCPSRFLLSFCPRSPYSLCVQGSVYDGGVFEVGIQLPSDYPFSAPRLQFKTKVNTTRTLPFNLLSNPLSI